MVENLSHSVGSTRFSRILIAENNFSTFESLIDTFGKSRLDLDFDLCTSRDGAMRKLLDSSYQLIISDAHLAEMDDFSLLKRSQARDTYVPFLITANAYDKQDNESVRRVLGQGAFDLISLPPEYEQTVRTIRVALWQGKLRNLIARKEAALEQYRRHLADYPDAGGKMQESFNRALAALESTISSIGGTILRMEESTVCVSDFATNVEFHARRRALERLDALQHKEDFGEVRKRP